MRNERAKRKMRWLLPTLILWKALVFVSAPLCFWLLAVGQNTTPQIGRDPEKIVAEGKKHMAEGRFPEAITAFNRLKQMAPLEPQAYFLSGSLS